MPTCAESLKDGIVVQRGEPQGILLPPIASCIVDFIGHFTRGRILRARSIKTSADQAGDVAVSGEVDADGRLEDAQWNPGFA